MAAKMTRRDRRKLELILSNLERGQAYLLSPDVLICRRKGASTTTLDFSNQQGEVCVSVDKQIGSDIALLHSGISLLRQMLCEEPSVQEEGA